MKLVPRVVFNDAVALGIQGGKNVQSVQGGGISLAALMEAGRPPRSRSQSASGARIAHAAALPPAVGNVTRESDVDLSLGLSPSL